MDLENQNQNQNENENTKWNDLVNVSNAEYTIIKTDDFLQLSYLKLKKTNKYELKIHCFYKKMYEIANYFNIEWYLIYENAYKLAQIYADNYTENTIISDKIVLDVLNFSYKNNFKITSEYYITVLFICIMST
jgi:hypothetical protein